MISLKDTTTDIITTAWDDTLVRVHLEHTEEMVVSRDMPFELKQAAIEKAETIGKRKVWSWAYGNLIELVNELDMEIHRKADRHVDSREERLIRQIKVLLNWKPQS